mgnify:CR=1 FL=1
MRVSPTLLMLAVQVIQQIQKDAQMRAAELMMHAGLAKFEAGLISLVTAQERLDEDPDLEKQRMAEQAAPAGGKKALTIDDYSKWKTLSGQELSGDGRWVAYVVRTANVPTAEQKSIDCSGNRKTSP